MRVNHISEKGAWPTKPPALAGIYDIWWSMVIKGQNPIGTGSQPEGQGFDSPTLHHDSFVSLLIYAGNPGTQPSIGSKIPIICPSCSSHFSSLL